MTDIPMIDLSPVCAGDADGERDVARQIDRACRDVGFFVVCGHGVEAEMIESLYQSLTDFFALPLSEKIKCKPDGDFAKSGDDYTPYGFSGMLEENAFAYMGLHGRPSDYVEKFSVGRLILDDGESLPFPQGNLGQDLRRKLKAYYTACNDLAARITELFTLSLDLPRDFFARRIDRSDDSLRAHMYPGFSRQFANDQGMGDHTDGTLITLLTHTAPGIQVKARSGEWITPRFRRIDDFIVNIGDLMAHWTQGQYVSTPHRVVLSSWERRSIVFFKLTNEDEMVRLGNRQMDALFGRTTGV